MRGIFPCSKAGKACNFSLSLTCFVSPQLKIRTTHFICIGQHIGISGRCTFPCSFNIWQISDAKLLQNELYSMKQTRQRQKLLATSLFNLEFLLKYPQSAICWNLVYCVLYSVKWCCFAENCTLHHKYFRYLHKSKTILFTSLCH